MEKSVKELMNESMDFLRGYYHGLFVASLCCLYLKEGEKAFDHQKTIDKIKESMEEAKEKIARLKKTQALKESSRKLN